MHVLLQFVWTPIAVFLVGYILLRWMGKKAVAEMNSFDLLVTMVLATAIAEPVVTKRLYVASYYAFAITVVYMILSSLTMKNKLKRVLISKPTILVKDGDIKEEGLRREKLTVNELLAVLRVKGYTDVRDVALAVMEQVGKVSVIPKADARPVQPRDMQLAVPPTFIPVALIVDGEIIDQNLKLVHRDRDWLMKQLASYEIHPERVKKVTLATFNQQNFVDVVLPNDNDTDVHYL